MLTKPDLLTARALHALVPQGSWGVVSKYLEKELSAVHEHMVTNSDVTVIHELRGRAKFLREFLKLCSETGPLLDKLEKSK